MGRLHGTGRYPVKTSTDSGVPNPIERISPTARELCGRHVPERVPPGVAKRAVVGKDLEVVVAVPPRALECAEDLRQRRYAVARQDPVGPAARRLSPVREVDPDEPAGMTLDVLDELRRVPEVPGVEL